MWTISRNSCSGLTNIIIPGSVTNIEWGAFSHCTGLMSVTIGDGVKSIGNLAFYNCSKLMSVTMGNGVTNIGISAFYHCSNLTSITIPDSVSNIRCGAFCGCKKLTLSAGIEKIKAVKGFYLRNDKLECRNFIFEVGKEYKEDSALLCVRGFHACTDGRDVFNYYFGSGVAYYEVELSGISPDRGDDSKICGTTIKLLRRLTITEAANYRSVINDLNEAKI